MAESLSSFFGQAGADGKKLGSAEAGEVNAALASALPNLRYYAESACSIPGGLVAAARDGGNRKLIVAGDVPGFSGSKVDAGGQSVLDCDADEPNMQALREKISWLNPILTGTNSSVGLGDRLGVATPGHIAAGKGCGFILVLSQQSIREMTRTGRSAQQVMDEAAFGVFQCGYDEGFGSDADHLKTEEDVDVTAAAGFTFFTIDPSDHVDDTVDGVDQDELNARFDKLVADGVPGASEWKQKYVGQEFKVGKISVSLDEPTLMRAAVKYGRAVAHVESMSKYIAGKAAKSEIELSVDETDSPTSTAEHFFIARELKDRGVKVVSLAPRFVGDFEKGIDYKGDVAAFEASMVEHAEIAREYGPYKISIHSGSDKFTVYPIVARLTNGMFHLKTAGTSYLEALRAVARHDMAFLRELIGFCRDRFDTDKATYHISAALDKVPAADELADGDLERVYLDEDDGRQILHVTFGSVLTVMDGDKPRYKGRLMDLLDTEEGTYVEVLKKHIGRHISGLTVS